MASKSLLSIFHFDINSDTNLYCPLCRVGKLVSRKDNMKVADYVNHNRQTQKEENLEPEWLKFAFAGYLLCNNEQCKEQIVVAGTLTVSEQGGFVGPDPDDYETEYVETCYPEYFERPPDIIPLEDYVPKEVRELIQTSFKLFWIDGQACANKIRMSVEKIMDLFDVQKYPAKGKRIPLSLQKRIDMFGQNKASVADKLTAIKWLGNAGSHVGAVAKTDLIDGYRIMQFVLRQLFSHEETEVNRIATSINKSRRPLSHKKRIASR